MLNLFKMDLRRMFRGKFFYILLVSLGVLLGTFALTGTVGSGTSIAALIGPVSAEISDMMASMGIAMTLMCSAIFITVLIGNEFATGYIKNILTVHAKKSDYFFSKLLISIICSAIMIMFYVLLMIILGAVQGLPFGLTHGAGGLVLFILERFFNSIALNAVAILIILFVRNRAIGILGCFLFGMGGVTMLLGVLATALNAPFIAVIASLTIAGSGNLITLIPGVGVFFQVLAVAVVWTVTALCLSDLTLKKKDLQNV